MSSEIPDHELMPPSADTYVAGGWFQEWDRYPRLEDRRSYARREIERLNKLGAPLVHLAVLLPTPAMQDAAFAALHAVGYRPRIRLRAGVVAPPARPNPHIPIPPDKLGRVLFAKTATLNNGPSELLGKEEEWSAVGRNRKVQLRQKLYAEREVGHEPIEVPIDEANPILRQWGVGTNARRYHPTCEIRTREDGTRYRVEHDQGMDTWIVEEVTDAMLEQETRPAPKPMTKGKPETHATL